jgi:hypothetical protein
MASVPITIKPEDIVNDGVAGSMLGKYHCRLLIGKYERPTPFASSKFKIDTRLDLPLPDILQDNTSVKYNGVELESVGDFLNGDFKGGVVGIGSRGIGSIASTAAGNFLGSGVGAIAEAIGNRDIGDRIGGAFNQGVRDAFPPDKIQTAFEQMMGASPNPNPSVAFQGPNLREFQFTWTFFPASKEESDRIHKIINILKRASLPKATTSEGAAILNYPDMVQLNFYPWDNGGLEENYGWNSETSIIRIKKCVMNNVSVDYNPSNSPAFFADGKPVAIRLSIGFSEIEYMLSHDWGSEREGETYFQLVERGEIRAIQAFGTITGQAILFGAQALTGTL